MNTDQLTRELKQKATETDVLRQASLEINTTLDLEEIFDIVLRTMDELFRFSPLDHPSAGRRHEYTERRREQRI